MRNENLSDSVLKLIGALSSHEEGRKLIDSSGLLTVFSQMFLSSASPNMGASLAILSNIARTHREIPRVSLVISCLMQDLRHDIAHRTAILQTLIPLIETSTSAVQEHDLQNSVLPLLSHRESPIVIVLVCQIFVSCDMAKLKRIQKPLLQRLYNVLTNESLLYPDLLTACVDLLSSMSVAFDICYFLTETNFVPFLQSLLPQLEPFPEQYQTITQSLFLLEQKLAQ
jgi:hypothetical protein